MQAGVPIASLKFTLSKFPRRQQPREDAMSLTVGDRELWITLIPHTHRPPPSKAKVWSRARSRPNIDDEHSGPKMDPPQVSEQTLPALRPVTEPTPPPMVIPKPRREHSVSVEQNSCVERLEQMMQTPKCLSPSRPR